MKILGYPLLSTHWNRLSIDDSTPNPSSSDIPLHKYALPRDDVNATDLYIPTMSFVTYCILVCYIRGVFGDEDTNIPDILIQTVWKCCMLQVCESLFMSLGFSLMGVSSIPFLDIIAYTGYKYFGLCINTLSWVLGGMA